MKILARLVISFLIFFICMICFPNYAFADSVAPNGTFSPNSGGWSNGSHTTTFSPSDSGGSGVYYWEYRLSTDGGTNYGTWNSVKIYGETSKSFTFSEDGRHRIQVRIYDNAGNNRTVTSGIFNIETILPSGTFTPSSSAWTNNNVVTVFNPSDNGGSGVARWRYRISTNEGSSYGTWSGYINGDTNGSITLSTQAKNKVEVEVIDNAGNVNYVYSNTYHIDKTQPNGSFNPNEFGLTNRVVATFTPTDSGGSGVASWQYRISTNNGASYGGWQNIPDGNPRDIILSNNGTNRIQAIVTDVAGNQRTITSGSYTIDSILPTSPTITVSNNMVSQLSFTISPGTDTGSSGVNRVEYKLSGSNTSGWRTYISKVTLYREGLTTIEARTVDNAGNYSAVTKQQVKIERLMTDEEIIVYPLGSNEWKNENIQLNILYGGQSVQPSIVSKKYVVTTSSLFPSNLPNNLPTSGKLTISTNGIFFVHIQYEFDNGRVTRRTEGPYKIDKNSIANFTLNLRDAGGNTRNDQWVNGDLTINMSIPSYGGGSKLVPQYRIEGFHTEWKTYYPGAKVDLEGEHRVIARIINEAGTITEQKYVDAKIDKTKPILDIAYLTEVVAATGTSSFDVSTIIQPDMSGINRVVLNNNIALPQEGFSNTYARKHMTGKPTSVRIYDNAGNVSDTYTFLDVPTLTFLNGYSPTQSITKKDIRATLNGTGILSYRMGDDTTECLSKPCNVTIDQNGLLTVLNTNNYVTSQKQIVIDNLDKTATRLNLSGQRGVNNNILHFLWNQDIQNPKLTCHYSDGSRVLSPNTGISYTFNSAENYTYTCILTGEIDGDTISSNTLTIYPDYDREVLDSYTNDVPEITISNKVSIDETRYGVSYFINIGKDGPSQQIPVPIELFH